MTSREPPRNTRGGIAGVPSFEETMYNEDEVLDAIVGALGRDQLPPDTWAKLHAAATRDARTAELAFAYEGASQGKRLRTLVPQAMAEFLFHAAEFFSDVMQDQAGSASYLERALDVFPGHEPSFLRLSDHLEQVGQVRALAELTFATSVHRSRVDQVELLRRAAVLFEQAGVEDRAIESYQQILRIVPLDADARDALEAHFLKANRHRDIARLLEQAIAAESKLDADEELRLRSRLLDLYVHQLKEPERTVPHFEAILAADPANESAARTAQRLLPNKSLAARAAAALADAHARLGMPEGASNYLDIELEHTRGPRRRDVLRRIGLLKQESLHDLAGAYAAYEAAITIDPSDDSVRSRYAEVAIALGRSLDASRVLFRALTTAKESALRAAISCESAALLRVGGEPKKAKSSFVSVLSMPGASDATLLSASRALAEMLETEGQHQQLAEMLTRISMLSEDADERERTLVKLAELAENVLKDSERAIFAWERLVPSPLHHDALVALQRLYDVSDRPLDLANVLLQREEDESDLERKRSFAFAAAETVTKRTEETERAIAMWTRFVSTYGGDRRAFAYVGGLLERERRWPELASVLFDDAQIAPTGERPTIFARLGLVHLTRLRNVGAAISAFEEALRLDDSEPSSRETLEKLLSEGDHRLLAARVLDPVYRAGRSPSDESGLLRVLDAKATLAETVRERLDAEREAFSLSVGERALLSATRGLLLSVAEGLGTEEWLERIEAARRSAPADPKEIARTLSAALGDRAVDTFDLYLLAKRLGEVHEECSDNAAALEAYRRGLSFAPKDTVLLERIDDILRAQGNPEERVSLYRATLAQGVSSSQKRDLLHRIGAIVWHELGDLDGAIEAFAEALADSHLDVEAYGALVELYERTSRFSDLVELLERHLPRATPEQARKTRVRIATLALSLGDKERASLHASALISDRDATLPLLRDLEDVVRALNDIHLDIPLFERRVRESADPGEQVRWLDELGTAQRDRASNPEAAKQAWTEAATVALNLNDLVNATRLFECVRAMDADDETAARGLLDLYEHLGSFEKVPELVHVLLRRVAASEGRELRLKLWRVYEQKLDDLVGAMTVAQEVLASDITDDDVRRQIESLAVRAKAQTRFFEQVTEILRSGAANGALATDFRLATARVAESEPAFFETMSRAYREVLQGNEALPAQRDAAVFAYKASLARSVAPERSSELRWLYAWQLERSDDTQKRDVLLEWADAEESILGDPRAAVGVVVRLVEWDPENPDGFATLYRLSLLVDDIDRATQAMTRRLQLSDGEGKMSLELELARLLVERTGRSEEALESVGRVLDASPSDPEALVLCAQLLQTEAVGAKMIALLERALESENDLRGKSLILETLLAGATWASPTVRRAWYDAALSVLGALSDHRSARRLALAGAEEHPGDNGLWEEAERLSRELQDPEPVAELYATTLSRDLAKETALQLGQRAVAFFEEWFEDAARVISVLTRMLDVDPGDAWAFDRLKLMYDTNERWEELFVLFERTMSRSPEARVIELLEEAALTAKDFAGDLDRAVRYFEELVRLRPGTARFSQALLRLYERTGRNKELANLLETEISAAKEESKGDLLFRLAELWAFKLEDAPVALSVLDRIPRKREDVQGEPVRDFVPILERIVELTANAEALFATRQSAALRLKQIYEDRNDELNRARMLEVELEATSDDEGRIDRYETLAAIYERLGSLDKAFELFLNAFRLDRSHTVGREALVRLAPSGPRLERLLVELEAVARAAKETDVAGDLYIFAAGLRERAGNDPQSAVELLAQALALSGISTAFVAHAAREAERLYEQLDKKAPQLNALERLAAAEVDPLARMAAYKKAAILATTIGEPERAIVAWRGRLLLGPGDLDALDGLVACLSETKRLSELVDVLSLRADARAETRAEDLLAVARILGDQLALTDRAIDAWRRLEEETGPNALSTRALHALYTSTSRFEDLAGLLSAASGRTEDDGEKASLLAELGTLYTGDLGSKARAVNAFAESLRHSPLNEVARNGLSGFVEDAEYARAAIGALLTAYRQTNDWERILRLTDSRLLAESGVEQRVEVLLESSKIAEERLGKREDAYAYAERALLLAPDLPSPYTELLRLAKARGASADLAASLGRALQAARPMGVDARARITFELATVLETELSNTEEALARYREALTLQPAEHAVIEAVIRTASLAGRWEVAANAFVAGARSALTLDERLLNTLSRGAEREDAWTPMLLALESSAREFVDAAPPSLARSLVTVIAVWQRDKRGDPSQAEKAFEWALTFDPANPELLSALAELQRRTKGRPLVSSLLRLSSATGGDLELLLEAAELAELGIQDRALAFSIYSDMYALAKATWQGASGDLVQTNAPRPPRTYVERSLKRLVALHSEEGRFGEVADLFADAAKLPFEQNVSRGFLVEAAALAEGKLGDPERAASIYRSLFDEDPTDDQSTRKLIALYESRGQWDELFRLRHRQVALSKDKERRLALRIELAALEKRLSGAEAALVPLKENFGEEPRHASTLAAFSEVLLEQKDYRALEDLYVKQAKLAEGDAAPEDAATLWVEAAKITEDHLESPKRASEHLERAIAHGASATALDTLARLRTEAEDHAGAADALVRLLGLVRGSERVGPAIRLADARSQMGELELARRALEDELANDPELEPVREKLTSLFREWGDDRSLADHLANGAIHAPDKATRLLRLREAADLYLSDGEATRAIPLLEQAHDLAPEDRHISLVLSEALVRSERFEEARQLLRDIIEAFGGRKPKERAPVHVYLAKLELALGDRNQAVAELEAATRIDPADPEPLRALAELSRDDGHLERAERSYRSLLTVLKHKGASIPPSAGAPPRTKRAITRGEVLLELSDIARRLGDQDRANEILESALEAASADPRAREGLTSALRDRGDFATLAKVLSESTPPLSTADLSRLEELAWIQEEKLGLLADAFRTSLKALEIAPDSDSVHESLRTLAQRLNTTSEYVTALEAAASSHAASDPIIAASLLVRAAMIHDASEADDRAAALYEKAHRLDPSRRDALLRLEQVLRRLGDETRYATTLESLLEAETDEARKRSLGGRLAMIWLKSNVNLERATALLGAALGSFSDEERLEAFTLMAENESAALDETMIEAARSLNDDLLLKALVRAWKHTPSSHAWAKEGADLALRKNDPESLTLLSAILENEPTDDDAIWALTRQAEWMLMHEREKEAIALFARAADLADAASARALRLEATKLAEAHGEFALAANEYEKMFDAAPDDTSIWPKLLSALEHAHDDERLRARLDKMAEFTDDRAERTKLEIFSAKVAYRKGKDTSAWVARLTEIANEHPESNEAVLALGEALGQSGAPEEERALYAARIERALTEKDKETHAEFAWRLGALLLPRDANEALEVFRAASLVNATNPPLLDAYLALLTDASLEEERIHALEQFLELPSEATTPPRVEAAALELARLRTKTWDEEGALRALSLGLEKVPTSRSLRAELEARYRAKGSWSELVNLYLQVANGDLSTSERSASLFAAATVLADHLADYARAKELTEQIERDTPSHTEARALRALLLVHEGNTEEGFQVFERVLSEADDAARPALYVARARVQAKRDDYDRALADWDAALKGATADAEWMAEFGAFLVNLVAFATRTANKALGALGALRRAEILSLLGDSEGSRAALYELLDIDRDNVDALRTLGEVELRAERWEDAVRIFARLLSLEAVERMVPTALLLADAAQRLGRTDEARAGLERARLAVPNDNALRDRLAELYESTGALRELAELSLEDARQAAEPAARLPHLIRAGMLLLQYGHDPATARAALEEAHAIHPTDLDCTAMLADALAQEGRLDEASDLLQKAIASFKGRRARELSVFYHRLARISEARGDREAAVTQLSTALDMDAQNGVVAAELAYAAMEQQKWEVAIRSLRATTMLKQAGPLPRALAYQHLGEIARHQGDDRRAATYLRRALDEDPALESARVLLQALAVR